MSVSVRDALRMAALYVVLSILWLTLAEVVLHSMTEDPLALTVGRQINVVVWVLLSALLIYVSRVCVVKTVNACAWLRQCSTAPSKACW